MTLLMKSGSVKLFLLPLLFLPVISPAQNITIPTPEPSVSMDSIKLAQDVLLFRNKQLTAVTNMPIYNPGTDAKIRIYHPTEDIDYNMPILGYKDPSHLRLENFNSDSLHSLIPKKPE